MRVAIIGSRDFPNADEVVSALINELPLSTEIVSGGARGIDSAAKAIAQLYDMVYTEFPAEWDKYGRRAGFLRNQLIVAYVDRVIAFWDGRSPGTRNTIELALQEKKDLEVIFPDAKNPPQLPEPQSPTEGGLGIGGEATEGSIGNDPCADGSCGTGGEWPNCSVGCVCACHQGSS